MVEILDIEGYTFDKEVLRLAIDEYIDFKGSEKHTEDYKWEIFGELNEWFDENKINEDNVVEFVEFLQEKNPSSGSFVHWSDLDDIKKFTEENSKEAVELFKDLYYGKENLESRISTFREKIEVGTPAFGYLLGAFNSEYFAPIKVGQFRDFIESFADEIPVKIGGYSIPEKYSFYYKFCRKMSEFIEEEGGIENATSLDAQDFYYSVEAYDDIKKEVIFLKYLKRFSERLNEFKDDSDLLISEIKSLPDEFLEKEKDYYEGTEKVKKIRWRTLNEWIEKGEANVDNIKKEVNSEYEKNILQAWNDFTIYGQIYLDYFKKRLNKYFENISEYLVNEIDIDGLEYHFVTYQGSQGFMTDEPWILFYPEEKDDHRDSYQFFFRILPEKIEYGLSHGENIEDSKFREKYVGKITEIDENSFDEILEKYNEGLDEFIELNKISKTQNDELRIWQISPGHHEDNFWPIFVKEGIAAFGYESGSNLEDMTKEEIAEEMGKNASDKDVLCGHYFVNMIDIGDIILAKKGNSKELYGIGVIKGEYYYDPVLAERLFSHQKRGYYSHFRDVEWILDFEESFGQRIEVDIDTQFVLYTLEKLGDERYQDLKGKLIEQYPELEKDFDDLEQISSRLQKKEYHEIGSEKPLEDILNNIFIKEKDAEYARKHFENALEYIGKNDDLKHLIATTYDDNKNKIAIDFGGWWVFSISRKQDDYVAHLAVDMTILPEGYNDWSETVRKTQESFHADEDVGLIGLKWDPDIFENKPVLEKSWKSAMDKAKDIFKEWKRSPSKIYHREYLYRWMTCGERLMEKGINYFWLTANPDIWKVSKIEDGGDVFYTAYNRKGNKRRIFDSFKEAKEGDKVIFYESTPVKKIVAEGTIAEGLHFEDEEGYDEPVQGITIEYDHELTPIEWSQLITIPDLEDSHPIRNKAQGSLFELTEKEYETIVALEPDEPVTEKTKEEIILDRNKAELNFEGMNVTTGLYFPEKIRDEINQSVIAALKSGKNIIFTGPPGTGKTKVARNIGRYMKENCECVDDFTFTTATADWTTFDTMGGYHPSKDDGSLCFKSGQFLKCFKKKDGTPVNNWLVIDEINRADIDKAFGQLFSVLSNDDVQLPFTDDEEETIWINSLDGGEEELEDFSESDYYVTKNWRLLATMNTYDKASLYEMSYAFMRRFAFIDVGVPTEEIDEDLIEKYISVWGGVEKEDVAGHLNDISDIWKVLNEGKRSIGPAIIKDMLLFLKENDGGDGLVNSLKLYVLPQLEGMIKQEQKDIFENIISAIGKRDELKKVAKERFEIELKESKK